MEEGEGKYGMEPILVGKNDAARITGLSVSTINRMLRDGQLTRRKARGRVLILVSELHALAEGVKA